MAGQSLICVDCATLLSSVEEAQAHAQITSHSNFSESTEALLNLVCTTCRKPCRTKAESALHTKRTGHTDFNDLTSGTAKLITLEPPKPISIATETTVEVQKDEEMAVPLVDGKLVKELEAKGFTTARATRALHYSGNTSLESAVNWSMEHENEMDIDEMPLVPASAIGLVVEAPKPLPLLTEEEKKAKTLKSKKEETRRAREIILQRLEEDKAERRRKLGLPAEAPIVSEPVAIVEPEEAKRMEEENARKRILQLLQKEKEEKMRAREIVRQKLEEDKAQRRRRFGLPEDAPIVSIPVAKEEPARKTEEPERKTLLPAEIAAKAEQMRNCLRSLKLNHNDDDAKVKRAFQTLLTYLGNVARNPSEEKFRKIRLSNHSFHERVGSLEEGIQFLELCGFEKIEDGEFLYLPRDKVDKAVLNSAGSELNSATVSIHWSALSKLL